MDKTTGDQLSRAAMSPEQFARGKAMRDTTRALRLNRVDRAREIAQKAVDAGEITVKDANTAAKRAKDDPVQAQFKRFGAIDATEVMGVATPEERRTLLPEYMRKLKRFNDKPQLAQERLRRRIEKLGLLPMIQVELGR
jgi:hypothetical protein